MSRITHLTIFVADQQAALNFYVNALGFTVHTDHAYEGLRWLTVCPPDQKDFEIALMLPGENERDLVGRQAGSHPLFVLSTKDCRGSYELLRKRGVEFVDAPEVQPWGISCTFKDIAGNMIHMNQPADV